MVDWGEGGDTEYRISFSTTFPTKCWPITAPLTQRHPGFGFQIPSDTRRSWNLSCTVVRDLTFTRIPLTLPVAPHPPSPLQSLLSACVCASHDFPQRLQERLNGWRKRLTEHWLRVLKRIMESVTQKPSLRRRKMCQKNLNGNFLAFC